MSPNMNVNKLLFVFIAIINNVYGACESSVTWKQIAGGLTHVSAASDGTVWGVNANDNIYRYNGNGWTQISGGLTQIDVGSANEIWGVNANDQIYRYNGNGWTGVSGGLEHVEVASDGTVWGVNSGDNIYAYNGNGWTGVSGGLEQISVGSSTNIWGVNDHGQIYYRDVVNNKWVQPTPGSSLKHVSVSADGIVYGTNSNDNIYRYNAGSNDWTQICGGLDQIEVGSDINIWGVNSNGQIYRGYEESEITDISFDFDAGLIINHSPEVVASKTCNNLNGGSTDSEISFTASKEVTETSSFSYSTGLEISIGATFSTGVPFIASGAIETTVTSSHEWTWGSERSETETFSATFTVSCAPGEIVEAQALLHTAQIAVPYTITLRTIGSQKTHYSYGTWSGTTAWDLYYETTQVNAGHSAFQNMELDSSAKGTNNKSISEMVEINVFVSAVVTTIMLCCFVCILKRCCWRRTGSYDEVKQIYEDENDEQVP